ncbi:Hypothetical protein CpphoP_1228 [Corynebacterium pseudotuberculosis]|nr:Hypothetical protein Cp12C_1500 [Corynebacterium pseudotuberculosis]AQU90771.1 Hypothetical protein CpphoP_1228 [Corynebacterium pseudotuberculosis]ATB62380.1 Hypothetical protein BFF96_1504 [Corynebacterium pseudotuberculosis]
MICATGVISLGNPKVPGETIVGRRGRACRDIQENKEGWTILH